MSQAWRHFLAACGAVALQAACLAAPALAQDDERLLPGLYPEAPAIAEPSDPFFDIDWSLALRGSYSRTTTGERFDTRLLPAISLEHIGKRAALTLDADAEIVRPSGGGELHLGGLRLGLQGGYDLSRDTRLTATGGLSITQALPGTPGVASDIATPARAVSGDIELGATRRFGKLNVGVTGGVARHVYGPTTLANGTVTDNSGRNYTAYDAGLRVGYQVTPIFEVFGQANLGRDSFDNGLAGPRLDATDTSLLAGVTGRWSSVLEASVSTGIGLRRFDEAGLAEVSSQLYDARIRFTPDPTWRFSAGLATTLAPPGPQGSGTTRIDHAAHAGVDYDVNSWLALRALANWNMARFAGSVEQEKGHGWGLGADYKVNAHTAVTADYDYDHTQSSRNGTQEAHRVTMGVTVSR